MLLRDARERPGHVPAIDARLGLEATGDRSQRFVADRYGPDPSPASQVDNPVADDSVKPGGEARPSWVERCRPSPDTDEGVLDQLLGQVGVPQKPDPRSVHRARVAVVEL
jgi:hypothetical protein